MIKWFHVVSIGTSSIRNFSKVKRRPPRSVDELADFIREDPRKASAELNAFFRFVEKANQSPPNAVGVHLLSTDTVESLLAGRAIKEYLLSKGYAVAPGSPEPVQGLGVAEDVFDVGLANLVEAFFRAVNRVLEENPGARVYLNLTGGFKAEASVLVLAGAIAGASAAYYIHENFREVVTVPLIPIKISDDVADLVMDYVVNQGAWDCDEFEKRARKRGLDPVRLKEDGLFMPHRGCAPMEWLVSFISKLAVS